MTAADFKKASSKFMSRRKNPLILGIDKLPALYPQSAGNPRRQYLLDNPAQENWAALSHQGARFKEGAMTTPDGNNGKSMVEFHMLQRFRSVSAMVPAPQIVGMLKEFGLSPA